MNERIKELVGQAKFMAEESINKQISANTELYAFSEKFAELIVQECAYIASHNVMNISTYSDAEFVSDLITQHFGVK
jgi:hypothetical protein